jgi:hypothetical protein
MFAGLDEDAKKRHHTASQEQLVKQYLAYHDDCFPMRSSFRHIHRLPTDPSLEVLQLPTGQVTAPAL